MFCFSSEVELEIACGCLFHADTLVTCSLSIKDSTWMSQTNFCIWTSWSLLCGTFFIIHSISRTPVQGEEISKIFPKLFLAISDFPDCLQAGFCDPTLIPCFLETFALDATDLLT